MNSGPVFTLQNLQFEMKEPDGYVWFISLKS